MRVVSYSLHLVTYLDILGFRELIKHKSADAISKMIRLVREAAAPDSEDKKELKQEFEHFSDLVIITTPVYSPENIAFPIGLVFAELLKLAIAQVRLIDESILVRGALTIGNLVRSYNVVYGPGLIRAYELEHDHAFFPRIVVDKLLLRELRTNPALRHHDYKTEIKEIKSLIRRDDDGLFFVDYLRAIESELRDYDSYFEFLSTHRELVKNGLRKFSDKKRIRRKYLWLRKYHNSTVSSLRRNFGKPLIA
jgi:hypothetical protein